MLWIISARQHRLAHPRAAEWTAFTAALQRHEHIDGLDASLENLGLCGTLGQWRGRVMDGSPLHISGIRLSVDGVAEYVEHPGNNRLADRRLQRCAQSSTGVPRAKPCVGVNAIPRIRCASSWVMTSTTICCSSPARSTKRSAASAVNRTSTTLPRTATTAP